MDLLRSAYETDCYFWDGSNRTARILWYKAPQGSKPLPFPHAFGSRNWDEDTADLNGVGEVYGAARPWRSGRAPKGVTGLTSCGSRSQFNGLDTYSASADFQRRPDGPLLCCFGVQAQELAGGPLAVGKVKATVVIPGRDYGGIELGGRIRAALYPRPLAGGVLAGGRFTPGIPPVRLPAGILSGGHVLPSISARRSGGVLAGAKIKTFFRVNRAGGVLPGGVIHTELVLLYDTFTAPDGTLLSAHTPDIGGPWVIKLPAPTIIGDVCHTGAALAECHLADVSIAADITIPSGSNATFGLWARYGGSGLKGYQLEIGAGVNNVLRIYRDDATLLASVPTSHSYGVPYHCVLGVSGNTITATDGTATIMATDSTYPTQTMHGFYLSSSQDWTIDNVRVTH